MKILVLGIGNILLGDEGVGVHVVRHLEGGGPLPQGVEVLDGGTGAMVLLGPMQAADRVILVDATMDGGTPGSFQRLVPRYSSDYPPTLTAHDIGLKDLLDCYYLMGEEPDVVLYAVTVAEIPDLDLEMSDALKEAVPRVSAAIREELWAMAAEPMV
ncbi:MAG: hydrogenase maturation protease [Holophagaceae bacterium]|nr:hydrogenase maturation protease [Holophagaceae bacterium]